MSEIVSFCNISFVCVPVHLAVVVR